MNRLILIPLAFSLFVLSACAHRLQMHSRDGEKLSGSYRFAREDTGLIRVRSPEGEVLNGKFVHVERKIFVEGYEKTFGIGSITVDGPDISSFGNAFGGVFGSSYLLKDAAYGQTFNSAADNPKTMVKGPLFYWTASLVGDRGTTMGCYFIGSSHTGHGFGKCKSHTGTEYSVDF